VNVNWPGWQTWWQHASSKKQLAYSRMLCVTGSTNMADYIVVLRGNWSKHQGIEWLEKFQKEVNKVTKYKGLEFTISNWGAEKEDSTTHKKATVEPTDYPPFLDMKRYWDKNKSLTFNV
jgi:hypothetical protein